MDIKNHLIQPAGFTGEAQGHVPKTLGTEKRFLDILAMWQEDGVVAQDAATHTKSLTQSQVAELRSDFDIADMASLSQKRAVLNRLVSMGVLTAQESELATLQMLPQAGPGGVTIGALPPGFDDMMEDPNYISHLQRAIEFDGLFSRSDDVRDARTKVFGLLQSAFGRSTGI